MRKDRGLSLVETVLTLLLLGLFIVIVSDITKKIAQSQTLSRDHARSLELITVILPLIESEILAAVQVVTPTGANSTTLTLRTLPYLETEADMGSTRLTMPLPSNGQVPLPADANWTVMDTSLLKTVLFDLQGGWLRRTYGTASPVKMGELSGFQTSLLPNQTYRISLLTRVGARDLTLTGVVFKP